MECKQYFKFTSDQFMTGYQRENGNFEVFNLKIIHGRETQTSSPIEPWGPK